MKRELPKSPILHGCSVADPFYATRIDVVAKRRPLDLTEFIESAIPMTENKSETLETPFRERRIVTMRSGSGSQNKLYTLLLQRSKSGTHRVAIAKEFQRQIAKLQREREKLFKKAVRTLKVVNDNYAWDYFMNDQCGYSTFLERLK